MNDDELERRLRGALSRPRPDDAVDTDDFLTQVHHGAKVRRVKRSVGIAAASVLAVTGGGLALNAGGMFNGTQTHVADGRTTPPTPNTLDSHVSSSFPPPTTPTVTQPSTSKKTQGGGDPTFGGGPVQVQISAKRFIAAKEVQPLSLTATGRDFQWVLGKTPNQVDECAFKECATVFSTATHGATDSWVDNGQLPAPPAAVDAPTGDSVSQIRFTKRADGVYDGWAFGGALWSTHDSGHTWSPSGSWNGTVTALESWGPDVYAGVSSSVIGDDTATLYRSVTSGDDWQPVDVAPKGLTSIDALATATGLVALIDGGQDTPTVYLSDDGDTWQPSTPCPAGTNPVALSSAGDPTGLVGALWVTCQGNSDAMIFVTDTTNLGQWAAVPNDSFPVGISVAAQSPTVAFVAGNGIPGIQRVPTTGSSSNKPAVGVGLPVLFGFTNQEYGYLLSDDGTILSTVDGGKTWLPYTVGDTQP